MSTPVLRSTTTRVIAARAIAAAVATIRAFTAIAPSVCTTAVVTAVVIRPRRGSHWASIADVAKRHRPVQNAAHRRHKTLLIDDRSGKQGRARAQRLWSSRPRARGNAEHALRFDRQFVVDATAPRRYRVDRIKSPAARIFRAVDAIFQALAAIVYVACHHDTAARMKIIEHRFEFGTFSQFAPRFPSKRLIDRQRKRHDAPGSRLEFDPLNDEKIRAPRHGLVLSRTPRKLAFHHGNTVQMRIPGE